MTIGESRLRAEENGRAEARHDNWSYWPVNWSALWVGALAALAAIMIFGLIGAAVGFHSHSGDLEHRVTDLRKIGLATLAYAVFSSFLAFAIGGWVAGKVAGTLHAEPAMLHGAIAWLMAVPLLVAAAALGAGGYLGGWHSGITGATGAAPYERPDALEASATEAERTANRAELAKYRADMKQWRDDAPKVARNTALGALTALLLGLMGGVIGGWMACGEPMSFTYRRSESANTPEPIHV